MKLRTTLRGLGLAAVIASAAASALVLASCGDNAKSLRESGDFAHPKDATLRMNHLQALATHNSTHYRIEEPSIDDWRYDHASLGEQLRVQGIRGLELDVHWDDVTGEYQVYHLGLLDDATRCLRLADCLQEIRDFSDENPGHHPIFVQFEMKYPMPGNATALDLERLDEAIRAVFPEELMVTPALVQGSRTTLAEAVAEDGWPTLAAARGRTMFLFDCPRDLCLLYAESQGSLAGRPIFPDSLPSDPFAAIMIANGPDAEALSLVNQGFIVRVFADAIADVLAGSNELDAALASGAQIISTDVPVPRADTAYVADIPGGTPSRCNPAVAPVDCASTDIEDPALLQGR